MHTTRLTVEREVAREVGIEIYFMSNYYQISPMRDADIARCVLVQWKKSRDHYLSWIFFIFFQLTCHICC